MSFEKWSTEYLLDRVKLEAQLPTNLSDDITNDQILEIATDEMLNYFVPNIVTTLGHYFEVTEDQTTSATTDAYTIPYRAIGGRPSDVRIISGNLNYRAASTEPDDQALTTTTASDTSATPYLYYVRNHKIVLYPQPVAGLTLRIRYQMRPGDLIQTSGDTGARRITGVTSTTLTVATVPAAWDTAGTALHYDVIENRPGFTTIASDKVADASGTSVVFSTYTTTDAGIVASSVYGDWVCPTGQSPIPQIPYELHPALYQRTLSRVLKALKDTTGAQLVMDTASRLEEQAFRLITPRVAEGDNKITPGPNGLRGF